MHNMSVLCSICLGHNCLCENKSKKIFKKGEKTLKKVLTNGNGCDILHERSKRECKKQRSLKIEQQIERTK